MAFLLLVGSLAGCISAKDFGDFVLDVVYEEPSRDWTRCFTWCMLNDTGLDSKGRDAVLEGPADVVKVFAYDGRYAVLGRLLTATYDESGYRGLGPPGPDLFLLDLQTRLMKPLGLDLRGAHTGARFWGEGILFTEWGPRHAQGPSHVYGDLGFYSLVDDSTRSLLRLDPAGLPSPAMPIRQIVGDTALFGDQTVVDLGTLEVTDLGPLLESHDRDDPVRRAATHLLNATVARSVLYHHSPAKGAYLRIQDSHFTERYSFQVDLTTVYDRYVDVSIDDRFVAWSYSGDWGSGYTTQITVYDTETGDETHLFDDERSSDQPTLIGGGLLFHRSPPRSPGGLVRFVDLLAPDAFNASRSFHFSSLGERVAPAPAPYTWHYAGGSVWVEEDDDILYRVAVVRD